MTHLEPSSFTLHVLLLLSPVLVSLQSPLYNNNHHCFLLFTLPKTFEVETRLIVIGFEHFCFYCFLNFFYIFVWIISPALRAKFLCLLVLWSIRYYISWKFGNLYLVYYFIFFNFFAMEDVDSIDMVIDSTTSNIQPFALCFDIVCWSIFFKP